MTESPREYIENRVAKIPETGCWIWMNCLGTSGYGDFRRKFEGPTQRAHRASYEAFIGEIPNGLDVCHSCDIRSCCNPDHLFLGSRKDNMQDASKKGRLKRPGEKSGVHKLRESDVRLMRQSFETHTFFAKQYGVSESCISHARSGRNWKHI